MEFIKHLLLRVADATNNVSETPTVDQTDRPQDRANGVFEVTRSESRVNPDTPMATFMELSHTQQHQLIIEIIHAFIHHERRQNYNFLGNHSHRHMNQEDLLNVSFKNGLYYFTKRQSS